MSRTDMERVAIVPGGWLTMSNARLILPAILIGAVLLSSCDSLSGPPDLGTVSGRVVLAKYLIPLQGERVTLSHPDYENRHMETGSSGQYAFEQVEQVGGWRIRIGWGGGDYRYDKESTLTVRQQTIVPDFELTPLLGSEFTLSVDVSAYIPGRGRQPIAGADVAIGAVHLITNAYGRCAFSGLFRDDWYDLTVKAPGFREYSIAYHTLRVECFMWCTTLGSGNISVNLIPADPS